MQRLEERIRAVYKAGGRDQLLEILLLSGGASDFFNRLRVVATLADQDNRLVENLKESTERLNSLLADLDHEKQDELAVRSQMDRQRALIEAKLAERRQTLAAIDSQVAQIIAQERQRELEEQERLRQALARLLNGGQHYEGPLPQTDDAVLNQFIETAVTYLGIPYMWGGDRPSTGFDCSGFTRFVYAQHGVDLPHYSVYQANLGIPVELKDIQPGDLVAFGFPVRHVGIYIGNGLYVHAP
ncbi:MAG: C40 family peptidase, partial [Candidatus Methanosuratus sp.]|nr:C40 family peptidase [Candidatus Methanosuratincola sp.]